jgi:nucleotide-binding universal stress UspA family protein
MVIAPACQRQYQRVGTPPRLDDMTTPTTLNAQGSIIVGVDGSPASEHAVMWAADEARLQRRDLTLVHALATVSSSQLGMLATAGIPPGQVTGELRSSAEEIVKRAHVLAADRCPGAAIDIVIEPEDARKLLLELGKTASMTVVGTRGHGLVAGLLLGSVSAAVVRHAETPVVVVRPVQASASGVLIAADGSEDSLQLVEHAYREASYRQVPLTIVHCVWDGLVAQARWANVSETDPQGTEARLRIAESVAGMGEKFPDVETHVKVTRGAVDACLVDLSAKHELMVIGRPPRSLRVRLTLAGLAVPIAEHAHCPVLVVP